eukprot:3574292-Prymnesium_polylepis.1
MLRLFVVGCWQAQGSRASDDLDDQRRHRDQQDPIAGPRLKNRTPDQIAVKLNLDIVAPTLLESEKRDRN